MSYLVFARKYRPQTFDELVGQEHVAKSLKSAIKSGKLAHAYIFSGPRGVGKTSCARILAKSLNCKDAPTVSPCGKCPACTEITEGRSLDVIEIDGASNRGIDDIRNLRESVKFAPSYAKFKVYIIDEVHQITTDGFNALLKTLEEPPPHVKFIFATTSLNKVISTIRSRCQKFEFRPISTLAIMGKLEEISGKEGIKIEKNALFAMARSSEGSLRDAESVLDQLASFSKEKITLDDVISILGIVEDDLLVSLTDKIINKDISEALSMADDFLRSGKDAALLISGLIEYFRNLMVAKIVKSGLEKYMDVSGELRKELLLQAERIALADILRSINILADSQSMFRAIESQRIVLEMAIINLIGATQDKGPASTEKDKPPEITAAVSKPKSQIQPPPQKPVSLKDKPVNSPVSTPKNNAQPDESKKAEPKKIVVMENIMNIWQAVIDKISKAKMSIATYLNEGNPLKVENNVLLIGLPTEYKFHKDVLERRENSRMIEEALSRALDADLRVNFVLSDDKPKGQDVEIEPSISSAIEAFKGKIVNRFRKE